MYIAGKCGRFTGVSTFMLPYCGDKTYDNDIKIDKNNETKTSNIVHQIVRNDDTAKRVYCLDKKFNSPYTFHIVSQTYGVGMIGPVKSSRKDVPDIIFKHKTWKKIEKEMNRGDFYQLKALEEPRLRIDILKDTKLVIMMSNCLKVGARADITRKVGQETNTYSVPAAFYVYNNWMGGCDSIGARLRPNAIDFSHRRFVLVFFFFCFFFFMNIVVYVCDIRSKWERQKEKQLDVKINDLCILYTSAKYPNKTRVDSKSLRLELLTKWFIDTKPIWTKPTLGFMKKEKKMAILSKLYKEESTQQQLAHELTLYSPDYKQKRCCGIGCKKYTTKVCSKCKIGIFTVGFCFACFHQFHLIRDDHV